MEPLKGYLKVPKPVQSRRTERGDAFDLILHKLNPGREASGREKLNHAALGSLLRGFTKSDVYALIGNCDEAADRRGVPWSAAFWMEWKNCKPVYKKTE